MTSGAMTPVTYRSTHSCTATATKNGDKTSFVYLPSGACSKIVGASESPGK
jgi:hypothetical protein